MSDLLQALSVHLKETLSSKIQNSIIALNELTVWCGLPQLRRF